MATHGVRAFFRRGDGDRETVVISSEVLDSLKLDFDSLASAGATPWIREAIARQLKLQGGEQVKAISDIEIVLSDIYLQKAEVISKIEVAGVPQSTLRHVSRCRRLLQCANFVLPPSVREDALDEWMDEIQSAAEENLPFRRRALSILFRSLPALALRARLSVRARRGEG
jgi:hypothetical protein